MRDLLIGGGLLAGGAALGLGSYLAQRRASKIAHEAFKEATERARKSEMAARTLNKLRRISQNDVNIGRMNQNIQDSGMADNAFYVPNSNYENIARKLMAKKVKGEGGSIAIGDKARALPIVAHELGHAENYRTGRFYKRIMGAAIGGALGAASGLAGMGLIRSLNPYNKKDFSAMAALIGSGASLGTAIGNYITQSSIHSEEKQATANAIEYLRKMKRKPEQLEKDKEVLDKALNTYSTSRYTVPLGLLGLGLMATGGVKLYNDLS